MNLSAVVLICTIWVGDDQQPYYVGTYEGANALYEQMLREPGDEITLSCDDEYIPVGYTVADEGV